MIQHFAGPVLAVILAFWGAVVAQYHHWGFHIDTPPTPPAAHVVIESTGATSSFPSPFENFVERLAAAASTTPSATSTIQLEPKRVTPPGPVTPLAPSIPFIPVPVPQTPPITAPAPQSSTTPTTPTPPSPPDEIANPDVRVSREAFLKNATVNIICLPGGGITGSSGSGIVIDSRGLILTVAHVGQGFLLRDYPTKGAGTCYIRTGSPAKNAYKADLVYISPSWVHANKATFLEKNPSGTGENDFAILAVTGSLSGSALPKQFDYIPMAPAGTKVQVGDMVGTASYAAEFLSSSQIRSSLYPTVKFAKVDDVFTFTKNSVDLFSVAAGSAAQEGSSGGAVMNSDKQLVGLISTRTAKANLALRDLQALTMEHIRASFRSDMSADLDAYLKANPETLISKFRPEAAKLLAELAQDIATAR